MNVHDAFGLEPVAVAPALFLLLRLLPLAVLLPFLGARGAPFGVWALSWCGLGLVLYVAAYPLSLASELQAMLRVQDGDWVGILPCVLSELVRGVVFALGVALPLHALAWTGRLADALRQAQLLDEHEDSTLGVLFEASALAVFFASGTHLLVLEHFVEGARTAPLGTSLRGESLLQAQERVVSLFVDTLALSITLAAPVLLCVLIAALCVGLLGRLQVAVGAGLREGGVVPFVGLAVVCFSFERLLSDVPVLVRVFLSEAERILLGLR
jgi:type III secretory pathway component EscT